MGFNYSMGDLKKGLKIEIDGIPYKIVEYQHVKPGKGSAFVRCKIKNFLNLKLIEKTFHAGDKCQVPDISQKVMQFLYDDGEYLQFMDNESYEQLSLDKDKFQEVSKWIKDGTNVNIQFHNSNPIYLDVPEKVELKVVETSPNFKGDTSNANKKPAKLQTGAVVQVPFHILEGDIVRINTIDGVYVEKVK